MDRRVKVFFRCGALVALCVLIFILSGLSMDQSTSQSDVFVDLIIRLFFHDLELYPIETRDAIAIILSVAVRKAAHFFEYMALGVLSFGAFFKIKRYLPRWLLAVLFSFVYACSDEFHQRFIPGRAGLWRDVFLDTSGAMVGAFIACFISMMLAANKILRENKKNQTENKALS